MTGVQTCALPISAASKRVATKKTVARKTTRTPRAPRVAIPEPAHITPEQALANTRALLEAKHAHDREAPAWQHIGEGGNHVPDPGFQSEEARMKANELHQGEIHQSAIQGSIGATDRQNQGKRDARG